MSGAFFYRFVERDQVKSYMVISYLVDKMDPNDFKMANLPYSLLYEKPVPRGPIEVHSNSPPSPPTTLESPTQVTDQIQREREHVGPHITPDPSVHGIDEFGTNTFQIHTWMATPAVPVELSVDLRASLDEQAVQESAPPPRPLAVASPGASAVVESQSHGNDGMETETEFELQRERRRKRKEIQTPVAEDVEMADPVGAQDVIINEEEKEIIDLGDDDDEVDHPQSSDDDSEDSDAPPRVMEMKPVIAPSGVVVKVEKDWWVLEEEKRMKRIARHKEKERKERERQQKDKELAEAKAKLIRLELES